MSVIDEGQTVSQFSFSLGQLYGFQIHFCWSKLSVAVFEADFLG